MIGTFRMILIAAIAAVSWTPLAGAQLRVTVEGVNFQPMPIAVPDFDGASPQAKDIAAQMAEVIRSDLSGSISMTLSKASKAARGLSITR